MRLTNIQFTQTDRVMLFGDHVRTDSLERGTNQRVNPEGAYMAVIFGIRSAQRVIDTMFSQMPKALNLVYGTERLRTHPAPPLLGRV